jgi:glycosyltransferase involved in cell wall biosynthesis
MKICLISQEYPPDTAWGGIGTHTWVKARALARLGHEVHVLSRARDLGPAMHTEVQDGVTVHRMQPPGFDFPIYGKPLYLLGYTWRVLEALYGLMQHTEFDVLDFPDYGGEGFAYLLDRTLWNWVPTVVQLHGPLAMFAQYMGWPEPRSRLHEIGTFMEGFSLRNADAIMACSACVAELAERYYGIPRQSIDVVYCGVDTTLFCPPPTPVAPPTRPTVLFVGNIIENKGAHVVAEAVLALRRKHPEVLLRMIGSGREVPERIAARFREEGAEESLDLAGFVALERLPECYRQAHVFCAPAAEYEGFGQVYIEAMGCACPAIASTAGGGSEAVVDGETGLVVPPNDVPATAQAIDRILSDDGLRRRMSAAGPRHVAERFAMDKYIGRVLAAYEKAIDFCRRMPEEAKDQSDWEVPYHYTRRPT